MVVGWFEGHSQWSVVARWGLYGLKWIDSGLSGARWLAGCGAMNSQGGQSGGLLLVG